MSNVISRIVEEVAREWNKAVEYVLMHCVACGVPLEHLELQHESMNVVYVAHVPQDSRATVRVAKVSAEFKTGDDGTMQYVVTAAPVPAEPYFPRVHFPERPGLLDGLDE